MVEVVSGLQTSLTNVIGGGLTYKGKPLEFKEVEGKNGQVFQASTNLTDEELALGNNDVVITFSLEQALGNVVVTRVPLEDEERQKIAEKVAEGKSTDKKAENFEPKEMNRAEQYMSTTMNPSSSSGKQEDFSGGKTAKVKTDDKDFKL